MLAKKFRQEKLVMGSAGSSDVGKPSSSTSGGFCMVWGGSCGASLGPLVFSRRNFTTGGGAASSSSD